MPFELLQIPGVSASDQTRWQIRSLALNGQSPTLAALADWAEHATADYKKIMKVMRIVGTVRRVQNEKQVRKSSSPAHDGAYEMRADKGKARLMFFYSENDEAVIVCTNPYVKGKGSQDTAFKHCSDLRAAYLKEKASRK